VPAAAVAAAIGLAGCVSSVANPVGAGHPAAGGQASHPAPAAAAASKATIAPLTGLPASEQAASRPAIALVIAGSRPQGVGSADVVFEEITTPARRYIAVFQSRQASRVGPITSTRPVDGKAVSVLHPLFGYDGGTPGFLEVLHLARVTDLGYLGHPGLYRTSTGGVTASTAAIWRAAKDSTDTPPPEIYLYRGTDPGSSRQLASIQVRSVTLVRVRIPGGGTQTWRFDPAADRWAETGGGPRVAVSNLIIQSVAYKQVFLSRRDGITAPSAKVIGTGRVLVVTGNADSSAAGHDGLAAPGTWSKSSAGAVTSYLDSQGIPMALQPGHTWVILAPPGAAVRTSG
jgi:hypothetical protein